AAGDRVYPQGSLLRAGEGVTLEQILGWVGDKRAAHLEPLVTVRFLCGFHFKDDNYIHADVYGKLFVMPVSLANRLICGHPELKLAENNDPRRPQHMRAMVEIVCDGVFRGDPAELWPMPAPPGSWSDRGAPSAPPAGLVIFLCDKPPRNWRL